MLRLCFLTTVAVLACTWTLPAQEPVHAHESATQDRTVRELYVPFDQFRQLQEQHPNGIVMPLSEYRDLVRRAIENIPPEAAPPPPVQCVITSAHYRGVLRDDTVQVDAYLTVAVRGDSWVECPLGALPPLARVLTDGEPGWVFHDAHGKTLVLRGAGEHRVQLRFHVAAVDEGDHTALSVVLAPSAATRLTLEVPGRVRGSAAHGALESTVIEAADDSAQEVTRFHLTCDPRTPIQLRWQRQQAQDANPVLLSAAHELAVLPSQPNPRFTWDSRITVSRRRLDQLTFVTPESLRVLRVDGGLVLRWERTAEGLLVVFKAPVVGPVMLRFTGVVTTLDGPMTVAVPRLLGAAQNHGFVTVLAPADASVDIVGRDKLTPVDPLLVGAPAVGDATTPLYRFSFREADAQLTLTTQQTSLRTEMRTSFIARVREKHLQLDGFLHLEVREGRTYLARLRVPAGWRLLSLDEVAAGGRDASLRGMRATERSLDGGATEHLLTLARAATPRYPLRLRLRAESTTFVGGRDWERRAVSLALPFIAGTQHARTDLGVTLHDSIALETSELPGWTMIPADESDRLGLLSHDAIERRAAARLVLAATTEITPPVANLELHHMPPRLEYRLVTHVLAAESVLRQEDGRHALRVRSDIELAVVGRALDELTITHPPLAAGTVVVIQGPDIKETESLPAAGVQRVRFERPWLGVRHLRVEYETAHLPGAQVVLPEVGIPGDVQGEHFLVLQSQGSVEVQTHPAATLAAIDLDELPDFAEQWPDSRVLRSYRQRRPGAPGALSTTIHERAPVLQQLIRSLKLHTVLAADGTARTQADLLLTYSRQQVLPVQLPSGSRCLGVMINGTPIHSVRDEGNGQFAIPLPPRSHAALTIFYEKPAAAAAPLSGSGRWRESGPIFATIPVGETQWTVYHPSEIHCRVLGGNVRPIHEADAVTDQSFASAVLGRIFRGQWPRFGTFRRSYQRTPRVAVAPLTDAEMLGAQPVEARGATTKNARLRSQRASAAAPALPRAQILPEGHAIETHKIGGAPTLLLAYRTLHWEHLSKRFVFFGTLCLALYLFRRHGRGALARFVGWGLFFGTLIPVALQWASPLLLVPFCEALVAIAAFWLLTTVGKALVARLPGRSSRRRLAASSLLILLFAAALLVAPSMIGVPGVRASARERVQPAADPFSSVVVPYHADGTPWTDSANVPVFLPEAQFRALVKLAEASDEEASEPGAKAAYILGSARYSIDARDGDARIQGAIPLYVFTKKWITLPLSFDRWQLERVQIDGKDVGVGQRMGQPLVELQGTGAHTITLQLRATVTENLGRFGVSGRVVAGASADIRALLPAGAELQRDPQRVAYVTRSDTETLVELPLDVALACQLYWSFPQVSGRVGAQQESTSYTELSLTRHGMQVRRLEQVDFTGIAQTKVSFNVSGDWEIRSVEGETVSEWQIVTLPGDAQRLDLFFVRPQTSARFTVHGTAPFRAGAAPVCTLSLINATRQETFVGLRHGGQRRFRSGENVLAGFKQKSTSDAQERFGATGIDRLYHAYGDGAGAQLQIEAVPLELEMRTHAVAVLGRERVEYFVRTSYDKTHNQLFRHEVALPVDWIVRSVQCPWVRSWKRVGEDQGRLVIEFHGAVPDGTELVWSAVGPLPAPPTSERAAEALVLPAPRLVDGALPAATVSETFSWSIAAHEHLEVLTADAVEWQSVALAGNAAAWVQLPQHHSYRLCYRARRARAPIALTTRTRPSNLGATIASFVRIAQQRIVVSATLFLRVGPGARQSFTLQLPVGAELVVLETANLASRQERPGPDGLRVDIELQGPVTGEHSMDLIYRMPRPSSDTLTLTPLHMLDGGVPLRDATHYVGIVQADRTVALTTEVVGLTPVEPERLPAFPLGVSAQSLTPTYIAVAPDWRLDVQEQWIEEADRLDALIQLADLSTIIGYDGTVRTQVLYTLRNDRLQFLSVELPAGTELWGVTVDGRSVAVGGGDAGSLRIPVPRGSTVPVEVAVSYAEAPMSLSGGGDDKTLLAPRLPTEQAVQVLQSIWSVQFPDGYTVTETGRRMRPAPASLRSAERLKNLLHQQESAYKAVQTSGSRKARGRAAQQLARIDQELGDNLAQLRDQNRGDLDTAQQIDMGDLNAQWMANDAIINETEVAQKRLREELRKQEAGAESESSRDEQLFQDRANFLRGRNSHGRAPGAGQRPRDTGALAAELLDGLSYPGWLALPAASAEQTDAVRSPRGKPVVGRGLSPLPATARPGLTPVLDPFAERPGHGTYTFRGDDANAELTLVFTPPGRGARWGAWLLLLAAAAVGFLAWQGRRQ